MFEIVFVLVMFVALLFAVWTMGCLIVKGMFKIADLIF